jgi:hypothetical protein
MDVAKRKRGLFGLSKKNQMLLGVAAAGGALWYFFGQKTPVEKAIEAVAQTEAQKAVEAMAQPPVNQSMAGVD